jgi:hypothetical protein
MAVLVSAVELAQYFMMGTFLIVTFSLVLMHFFNYTYNLSPPLAQPHDQNFSAVDVDVLHEAEILFQSNIENVL